MRFIPISRLAFAFVVPIALCPALAYPQQPSRQPAKATQGKPIDLPSKHSGPLPKADFGRPSTEPPAKLIHRQARETRRKNYFPFIVDPGRLDRGSAETAGVKFENVVYFESSEPFPQAAYATTILIGRVKTAQGFVSQDRTYVYSDFEVSVEEVLKQDPQTKLTPGQSVLVSRPGATVYFPSGHVRKYMVMGKGMPKVAAEYVFFLWKPTPDLPEYEILDGGAFELDNGTVHPLDERGFKFDGADAKVFLADLRKAVGASKN